MNNLLLFFAFKYQGPKKKFNFALTFDFHGLSPLLWRRIIFKFTPADAPVGGAAEGGSFGRRRSQARNFSEINIATSKPASATVPAQ